MTGGAIARGGFSPSANFILTLSDGRKIFAKGNHPGEMAHGTQNLRQDIAVYQTAPALADIAPRYLGCVDDGDEDGWMLGLWDGIDVAPAPPALPDIMRALLHWQTGAPPDLEDCRTKNYISGIVGPDRKWNRVRDEPAVQSAFIAMFQDADAARIWLEKALPALIALQSVAAETPGPRVPLHGDLHPSNVFQDRGGRVMIVDWPNACRGPACFDPLFLGAALGDVETVLAAYAAAQGAPLAPADFLPLAAALSGFMADQARRAPPPRLPRLRWMQKTMMYALLDFIAGLGDVPPVPHMTEQRAE